MTSCVFVSDLHGRIDRYEKLFSAVRKSPPDVVFLGGDLLPPFGVMPDNDTTDFDFIEDFLHHHFQQLRHQLHPHYPSVYLIPGNDDPRNLEQPLEDAGKDGLWRNLQGRVIPFQSYFLAGYAFVPPTPFRLKDWERYDVSRFVDPGCIPPEEGSFSLPVSRREVSLRTIQRDLEELTAGMDLARSVFLFHSPPYDTVLDRAALDGKMVEHAPLDVHVGSIAIRRFLERAQPLVSMHGHVHESAELTGSWKTTLGRTCLFGGAHSGPELALVRFTLENPSEATRELV